MVAKGCGSVFSFPTIKTYRETPAVTQYINYTVFNKLFQENKNAELAICFMLSALIQYINYTVFNKLFQENKNDS
jgi:hypothetical protein